MAVLTFEKRQKVYSLLRELKTNQEKLKETIVQLMAHPDTTEEQIATARKCLIDLREKQQEVFEKAQKYNIVVPRI
jgi:hypothetical protein